MRTIIITILLVVISTTCFATFRNPVETASDTIRQNTNSVVDDTISKIKLASYQAQQDVKNGVKSFLKWILEVILSIFTIVIVGYTFSYLVPKSTGRMMLIVTVLCAINEFSRWFL